MKKIKKIFTSALAITTLAPIPMIIASCTKTTTVATRKLTFLNAYEDSSRSQIGAAAYKVSTSEIEVGKQSKITITLDKYSVLNKVTPKKQCFEIYQTNPFDKRPGALTEGKDYTVEGNDTTHVYTINFTAEQSKKLTKDMTIRFKAHYKSVKIPVTLGTADLLGPSLDDWKYYNQFVNYDYSFLAIPRHIECGYEVTDEVISSAKIYGVKGANRVLLNDGDSSGVKIEKALGYFKVQNTGDAMPSQSHYMKVSIPMTKLFDIDNKENFTPKYDSIDVTGTVACRKHKGTEFGNKFVLNPVNCSYSSRKYGWKEGWTWGGNKKYSGCVCYEATFKAEDGRKFNFDYDTTRTKLPISSLRVQPRNEAFKALVIDPNDLPTNYFIAKPAEGFDYFLGEEFDAYPKLENWLQFDVNQDNTELTVRILITKMCNYVQLPTSTITIKESLSSYTGGCIDFLDYLSMDVVAE